MLDLCQLWVEYITVIYPLIKASQKKKSKTIVSIFVNPTQFNKTIDFKKYPRNIKKDIISLKKLNVNYLFLPTTKDIYKFKARKFVLKKKIKYYVQNLEKVILKECLM